MSVGGPPRDAMVFRIVVLVLHFVRGTWVIILFTALGSVIVDGFKCLHFLQFVHCHDILPLRNLAVHDTYGVSGRGFHSQLLLQLENLYILWCDDLVVQLVIQLVIAVDGDIVEFIIAVVLSVTWVILIAQ